MLRPALPIFSPEPDSEEDVNMVDKAEELSCFRPRLMKDPIHDYIEIDDPMLAAFIDSPQMQRLRYLKQLGTSYFVWLGASHNRFEHSIGVCHLSGLMVTKLRDKQPELKITPRDVRCVRLAGLCHDLGHGPFSHVWDSHFMPRILKRPWDHETGSEMMLDYLIEDNNIAIEPEDVEFIKALIKGEPERCPGEKPFLFQIVANKLNGIDVDKFDYIYRDSYCLNVKCSLDFQRLIHSCRVIKNKICYHSKEVHSVYDLFYSRYSLHKRIYSHKAAKAIEWMIVDALVAAEPYLQLVEKTTKAAEYLHLTDSIVEEIEKSKEPELQTSRAIIKRIRTRDLYRVVDYRILSTENKRSWDAYLTPAIIAKAANALNLPGSDNVREEDIIVDWSILHFGMKEKNPMSLVKFYSTHKPNKAFRAQREWASFVMPESVQEIILRCMTKDASKFGLVQKAYRDVVKTLRHPLEVADLGREERAARTMRADLAWQLEPSLLALTEDNEEGVSFGPRTSTTNTPKEPSTPTGDNPFTSVPTTFSVKTPMESPIRRKRPKEDPPEGDEEAGPFNGTGTHKKARHR